MLINCFQHPQNSSNAVNIKTKSPNFNSYKFGGYYAGKAMPDNLIYNDKL